MPVAWINNNALIFVAFKVPNTERNNLSNWLSIGSLTSSFQCIFAALDIAFSYPCLSSFSGDGVSELGFNVSPTTSRTEMGPRFKISSE